MYVVLHPIMNGSRNQADLLCTRRCQFAHCLTSHCFNTLHWSKIISDGVSKDKAELLQVGIFLETHFSPTQFPTLGIFINKKVGNRKN